MFDNFFKFIPFVFFQIGESGRSTRELEKTIALLKKVVEKTQLENEQLKKAPGIVTQDQMRMLKGENQGLKVRGHGMISVIGCNDSCFYCYLCSPIIYRSSDLGSTFLTSQDQLDDLRSRMGATLSDRYVHQQKGTAKVVADHEKIRKDLMKVRGNDRDSSGQTC